MLEFNLPLLHGIEHLDIQHQNLEVTSFWPRRYRKPLDKGKMVYYFTSNVVDPPAFIYVGKDKVESMAFAFNLTDRH